MADIEIILSLKDENDEDRKRLIDHFLGVLSESMTDFIISTGDSEPAFAFMVKDGGKLVFYDSNAIYHGDERDCLLNADMDDIDW